MFRSIWSKSLRDYRVAILAWGFGLALLAAIEFAESTPTTIATLGSLAPLLRFQGEIRDSGFSLLKNALVARESLEKTPLFVSRNERL
jgi:hypothetical protein